MNPFQYLARIRPEEWLLLWSSVHEAAHAVTARYFGWEVTLATLDFVTIPHPAYRSFDDPKFLQCLVISAAGEVATTQLLRYTGTGTEDAARSRTWLLALGAHPASVTGRLTVARRRAEQWCQRLRPQILSVACALAERGSLNAAQIDNAMRA